MKVPSEVESKEWILNGRWPGFGYCQIRIGPLNHRASALPAAAFASRMARTLSRIGLGQLLFSIDPAWLTGTVPPDLDPTLSAFLARHGDDLRRRMLLPLGDAEADSITTQPLSPISPTEPGAGVDVPILADLEPPRLAGPIDTAGAALSLEPEPIAKSNFTVVAPVTVVPAGKPEISPAPNLADKAIELEPQEMPDAAIQRGPEDNLPMEVHPALLSSPDTAPPPVSLKGLSELVDVGAPSTSAIEPMPRLAEPLAATPPAPSEPPPLGIPPEPVTPELREAGQLAGLETPPTEGNTNRMESDAVSPEIVSSSVELPRLHLDKPLPPLENEPVQPALTPAPLESALPQSAGQTLDVPTVSDLGAELSAPLSAQTPGREDGTVDTWTKAIHVPPADVNRLHAPLLTTVVRAILNRCKTRLDTTKLDFRWSLADLGDWELLSQTVSNWSQTERLPPHWHLAKSRIGRLSQVKKHLGLPSLLSPPLSAARWLIRAPCGSWFGRGYPPKSASGYLTQTASQDARPKKLLKRLLAGFPYVMDWRGRFQASALMFGPFNCNTESARVGVMSARITRPRLSKI